MVAILHVCLEYPNAQLLLALGANDFKVAVVAPYYANLQLFLSDNHELAIINHFYKGVTHQSVISCVVISNQNGIEIPHYYIKPLQSDVVKYCSNPALLDNAAIEYFNSAVASMVRAVNSAIPIFDIVHLYSWHNAFAGCLIKEFASVYKDKAVNKIPYLIVNMDANITYYHEQINNVPAVLASLNLPADFVAKFNKFKMYINANVLSQQALYLLYADLVVKDLADNNTFGLKRIFVKLNDQRRVVCVLAQDKGFKYIALYNMVVEQPVLTAEKLDAAKDDNMQSLSQLEIEKNITVLHIALEYGSASLGGLGAVTTQMVAAQNKFICQAGYKFNASIITPYYSMLYKDSKNVTYIAQTTHLYNSAPVTSNVYLCKQPSGCHYMIKPCGKYQELFNIVSIKEIYNNTENNQFIERVKYFNSAVAAYVHDFHNGVAHPQPSILMLHDWQAALVPKLLVEVHANNLIKSIFIVHVSNVDCGIYAREKLQGLGLDFDQGFHVLKAIGMNGADIIVTVSDGFLQESMLTLSNDFNQEYLRRILVLAKVQDKKVVSILNGFNCANFSPARVLNFNLNNVFASKSNIKISLANQLSGFYSSWRIDPNLPVIFYIGRFSPEKGVDVFETLIHSIKDKAVFFALGRGLTPEVQKVMGKHSRKTNNVFISNNENEQLKYGAMMRACADFMFIPSYREACGLVPMEGFANGAMCITSGVGGLKDSVSPLAYEDHNNIHGSGFIYNNNDKAALNETLNTALHLWTSLTMPQKNAVHLRIMAEAKNFDWLAPNGALFKYLSVCQQIIAQKNVKQSMRLSQQS
jgi:glycogen synthase